jgi:glyoxylase-like metal-dependent hydrolase (beta-lactamase superfamily II)
MLTPLGAGLDYIDLQFLGAREVIATALVAGRSGVALIDPGPSTTLPALESGLAARGLGPRDIRAILLTHIHLDHAGATGTLLSMCPDAVVHVHAAGAPHLANPAKLLASASRLYGADMERLWGEVRAVPADRIRVTGDEPLEIAGHRFAVTPTPGHASHHLSYFHEPTGVAFVGDTAGICRGSGRVVLPPTPPPDIDLEAWKQSTARILAWHPEVLFLTHFGPHRSPAGHFSDLWTRLEDWSRRVKASLEQPGTDAERAARFTDDVMDELARATSRAEAQAYAYAGRFDFSWAGLARYWRGRSAIS